MGEGACRGGLRGGSAAGAADAVDAFGHVVEVDQGVGVVDPVSRRAQAMRSCSASQAVSLVVSSPTPALIVVRRCVSCSPTAR